MAVYDNSQLTKARYKHTILKKVLSHICDAEHILKNLKETNYYDTQKDE